MAEGHKYIVQLTDKSVPFHRLDYARKLAAPRHGRIWRACDVTEWSEDHGALTVKADAKAVALY